MGVMGIMRNLGIMGKLRLSESNEKTAKQD